MNAQELRRLLEGLADEIEATRVDDPELSVSLGRISEQVQQSIAEIDASDSDEFDHESLRERAGEAFEAFEMTHPRLIRFLSDLLSALSPNRL